MVLHTEIVIDTSVCVCVLVVLVHGTLSNFDICRCCVPDIPHVAGGNNDGPAETKFKMNEFISVFLIVVFLQ